MSSIVVHFKHNIFSARPVEYAVLCEWFDSSYIMVFWNIPKVKCFFLSFTICYAVPHDQIRSDSDFSRRQFRVIDSVQQEIQRFILFFIPL